MPITSISTNGRCPRRRRQTFDFSGVSMPVSWRHRVAAGALTVALSASGVPAFEVYTRVRPVYFIQGRDKILIVNEGDAQVRRVYLNVPHSKNPKPSWYGESVGHYEGDDTLVVDTIGLSDKTFVDNYLTPHTKDLHVVERFTLGQDGRTLEVTVTVEDPGAFTTRWSARQIYHLEFQGPWDESPCAENNANYFGFDVSALPQADKPDF